jgi:methionine synthase I (cobalamin-dependent)
MELARAAAGHHRYVLFDVGPTPDAARHPIAGDSLDQAIVSRADGLLVETCSDVFDVVDILKALARSGIQPTALPVLLSWTFRRDRNGMIRTAKGASPGACAQRSGKLDIAALGVNCGRDIDMDDVIRIIREFRDHSDLPLFARPNAGTPHRVGDRWVYPCSPAEMPAHLPELLESGIAMIGGCCGTTPLHIAAFRPIVAAWNARNMHSGP